MLAKKTVAREAGEYAKHMFFELVKKENKRWKKYAKHMFFEQ